MEERVQENNVEIKQDVKEKECEKIKRSNFLKIVIPFSLIFNQ